MGTIIICFQNFYKFYNRYISSGRNVEALLPTRRGPRPKYVDMPISDCTIVEKILAYRKLGYNKYIISESLKRDESVKSPCSASTVYRILYKHGVSRLNITTRQEHKKIVREYAGSLVHLDCHYLPKGVVKAYPEKRYYVVCQCAFKWDHFFASKWDHPAQKKFTYFLLSLHLLISHFYVSHSCFPSQLHYSHS